MKPIHPVAQIEMLAELASARLAAELLSIEQLLNLAGRLAGWASTMPARPAKPTALTGELAELLAARASRLIPGAECMHRALAGRVWLARRGIDAQIVVGFRKRGALEGHAWLELATSAGPQTLFRAPGDGYRESFREAVA